MNSYVLILRFRTMNTVTIHSIPGFTNFEAARDAGDAWVNLDLDSYAGEIYESRSVWIRGFGPAYVVVKQ